MHPTCGECDVPLICWICDTCTEHCHTEGGPDACWEAHERWRLGSGDPSFGAGALVTPPKGILSAPKPEKIG